MGGTCKCGVRSSVSVAPGVTTPVSRVGSITCERITNKTSFTCSSRFQRFGSYLIFGSSVNIRRLTVI